jgi:hypothetical protein
MFQQYPKWRYHATEAARIVNDPLEEAQLGEGWGDAPVEAAAPAVEAAPVAPAVDPTAPPPPATPGAGLPPEVEAERAAEQARVDQLAAMNAETAIAAITQMTDEDALMRVHERETAGKNRKTVLAAVQARVKQLQETPPTSA